MPYTEILLSPFWESVDERWIGTALLTLSVLTLCSQCLSVAIIKSWRMYMASATFAVLAAVIASGYADSFSPRELQRFIMLPQTLSTLAVLQIFWTSITVFGCVKMELNQDCRGFISWCQAAFIRLITVIPSPIFVLFVVWVEQNAMLQSHGVKPQAVGVCVGGAIAVAQVIVVVPLLLCLDRGRLISLHLLIGCVLLIVGSMLPCLAQKLHMVINSQPLDLRGVMVVTCVLLLFVLFGIFTPSRVGTRYFS